MSLRPLRVLLVSPLPEVDPFNGDVVYTQALLAQPPPGVNYIRYDDALRSGELVEHGRRTALYAARSRRDGALALTRIIRERAVNAARRHGVLYREPFRFLEIRGAFDLVHCHTFSVRWSGKPTPVLVSNAVPLSELYERARGWSHRRVGIADGADRLLARALGVMHIEHGVSHADRVVAFTHTLARWYIDRDVPQTHIGVTPCFPPAIPTSSAVRAVPGRIGFVAGDFAAKGGETVLQAMDAIRARRPDAHLWIAGGPTGHSPLDLAAVGATWSERVSRKELLSAFLPSCEVFAYPSHFDGLPLTLLEALASGVPAVVSDYFALPEVVGTGRAGRVVPENDPGALSDAVLDLLDPAVHRSASIAARARYEATFSPAQVLPVLRANYDVAINHRYHQL